MSTTLNSCGGNTSHNANAQPKEPETVVLIKTSLGDIKVKLYNETPLHRNNFIQLVEEQYYDSVLFHRVIKDFMVQTGDPQSKGAAPGVTLGTGGPGYMIDAEFVYPQYFHKRGALSAARMADQVNPDRKSSGSQFYIVTGKRYGKTELEQMEGQIGQQELQNIFNNLCQENRDTIIKLQDANDNEGISKLQNELIAKTNQIAREKGRFHFNEEQIKAYTKDGGTPFLDNQYTVFGEVIDGMEVVDKIEKLNTDGNDRPKDDVMIISAEVIQ